MSGRSSLRVSEERDPYLRRYLDDGRIVRRSLLVAVAVGLVFFSDRLVRFLPEPIGSNGELFQQGVNATLLLALVSGTIGLLVGLLGALVLSAQVTGG